MGSLSDYAELELLDHVCNAAYSPASTVYLGLSTADPTDDASGLNEPSGNGYVRKAITFGAAASRKVTQSGDVTFDEASGSWGTITHYGIFDAESSGNMLAHGAFADSKEIVSGNTASVASTEVYVEFSAGEISNFLANKLLDLMFRNQAYGAPDTYVALVTATTADDDTGSTITEPSGGSYARVQVNVNGGSSPTWDVAASGLVDNTHLITFPTATGDWTTVVGVAICSASTAGDLLFYDNDMGDQAVGNGDTCKFPIGDLDIQMS
jgi:hypothetical protein